MKLEDGLFIVEYEIEGEPFTVAMSGDELKERIKVELERSFYGQDAIDIKIIWEYTGTSKGTLQEVEIRHVGSSAAGDNDYTTHRFSLEGSSIANDTFAVRIDGRA